MPEDDRPVASPARPPDTRTPRRDTFDTMLVAGAVVAGALSTGQPESAVQWVLLAIAGILGGIAPHTPLSELLRVRTRRLLRRLRPVGLRRLLVSALVVVAAAGLGRTLVAVGPGAAGWGSVRIFGCADPIEVRILATAEGVASVRELAATFEKVVAADNHGCATVNLYVYDQPPATAQAALASGWSTNHLRTLGPRPDLWLPGSTGFALEEPAKTSNGLLPHAASTTVAYTPLVLAVPAVAAPEHLGAEPRTGLTWAEALAATDDLGWGLARPDPASSVAAELATVAMYASGGGEPERLARPAAAGTLIDGARAREIEERIASGLIASAYPLGDTVDLLCRQRQLGSPHAALIMTEQQMVRFNAGLPLGGSCAAKTRPLPAGTGFLGVYPADTLDLDYPLIRLDWPQWSTRQREAVERFESWLRAEDGKQALNDAGLRPVNRAVGEPLSEARGALPGVPRRKITPAEPVLRQVREIQTAAQRPGRLLLALDSSSSMATVTGPGGKRRFDVATAAIVRSMALMTDRDEFGLWVFPGPTRRARELVPIGPGEVPVAGVSRREATSRALGTVVTGGSTPLYRTIVDGVAALSPADPERANALVVLTDGEDRDSGLSRAAMVQAVRGKNVRVFLVAVGEGSCGARAVREVTRVTAGGCVRAAFDDIEARLVELFRMLWGGS